MERPAGSEYHEYFRYYIDLVPEGDVLVTLREGVAETAALLADVPEEVAGRPYASGRWCLKDLVAHLIDSERAFGFRAFWFARQGPGALPSFDADPFAAAANAPARPLAELVNELVAVREAHVALFAGLDDETSRRTGEASGTTFSVRSFPYIIAGHEIHHRRQMRERYHLLRSSSSIR